MVVGRGSGRKTLLNDINWTLPPRARYAILGQRGAGKTTLLEILNGMQPPTEGWVERHAMVSATRGLLRFAPLRGTPRQLVRRLSKVYNVNERNISKFVEIFSELDGLMDTSIRELPRQARQRLSLGLFYGFPCDYYLFDEQAGTRNVSMREKVRSAQLQRGEEAGMVLATSSTRAALDFGGIGGILFQGELSFFASVEEAVVVYERIMIEHPVVDIEKRPKDTWGDDEGDGELF